MRHNDLRWGKSLKRGKRVYVRSNVQTPLKYNAQFSMFKLNLQSNCSIMFKRPCRSSSAFAVQATLSQSLILSRYPMFWIVVRDSSLIICQLLNSECCRSKPHPSHPGILGSNTKTSVLCNLQLGWKWYFNNVQYPFEPSFLFFNLRGLGNWWSG